jgi:hypothetical protein
MSSYRLDRMLLCMFCRRSGSINGRQGQWFLHRATHRLLCHHPTTALSGSRSEWLLTVPYSENVPQRDSFTTLEDTKLNATAELRKIAIRILPQVLTTVAGSMERVRARKGLLWRWSGKRCLCRTITVQYHFSGNFLVARRITVSAMWRIWLRMFRRNLLLPSSGRKLSWALQPGYFSLFLWFISP